MGWIIDAMFVLIRLSILHTAFALIRITSRFHFSPQKRFLDVNAKHPGAMITFWHEISYLLLLLPLDKKIEYRVIVSAAPEANIFSSLLRMKNVTIIRMDANTNLLAAFRKLKSQEAEKRYILFVARDGPFGPYKVDNKFNKQVASILNIPVYHLDLICRNHVRKKDYWDKRIIPLPFTKIDIDIIEKEF